jgi:hypothetical protein
MKMAGEAKNEPYDFGKNFKELSPENRISIILTARRLLKIQKENKAMLTGGPVTNKKKEG